MNAADLDWSHQDAVNAPAVDVSHRPHRPHRQTDHRRRWPDRGARQEGAQESACDISAVGFPPHRPPGPGPRTEKISALLPKEASLPGVTATLDIRTPD